ncbi:hypothetical protein PLCT1_01700 [Planctomycetaceae bacterium]|nr:hypothetical protein PLCT1_01700 [Planctomycetaceae bacterium]
MITRHQSYWEIGVPFQPAVTELPARVELLIVGAGFMGCWLAYWIAKRNPTLAKNTLVVERDLLGYGASTRNAGFLTSGNISEMLADSREVGFDAIFEQFTKRRAGLTLALGEFPDLPTDPCGSADYDPITPEKRALCERLNAALRARGEAPAFELRRAKFGGREREVFFNAADRGVNPVQLLTRLRERAIAGGVRFAFGADVARVASGHAQCTPSAEGAIAYARALICVNAFAKGLLGDSHIVPGRGQVIVTSPVAAATSHHLGFLNDGYDYFKFVDGRLLIGGGRDRFRSHEETTELSPTAEVREYLESRAREVIGHDRFTVDHHWAGIMGFPGGRHTSGDHVRPLDTSTSTVNACGGMGVALTPLVARDIATRL